MAKKNYNLPVLLIGIVVGILGIFVYGHFNMRVEDADAAATDAYSREHSTSIMKESVADAKIAFTKGTGRDQAFNTSYDDGAIAILAAELFRARTFSPAFNSN